MEESIIKGNLFDLDSTTTTMKITDHLGDFDYELSAQAVADHNYSVVLSTGYAGYDDLTNVFILSDDQITNFINSLTAMRDLSRQLHNIMESSNATIDDIKYKIANNELRVLSLYPLKITTLDIGSEMFGRIIFGVYINNNGARSIIISEPIHSKDDYTRIFETQLNKILENKDIEVNINLKKIKLMADKILELIETKNEE